MNLTFNEKLAFIGIRVNIMRSIKSFSKEMIDIEKTIIEIILRFPEDARLVSLLFSWIKVHGSYVIVEKLAKYISRYPKNKYPAIQWVSAIAAFAFENGSHKWKKLIQKLKNPLFLFPEELTRSAIELKGNIEWLKRNNIIVPNGAIRIRESDVFTPSELIKYNRQYKNRYLYGASWRADIITTIELGLRSPTVISRLIGCSYEPAHRILHDYLMVTEGIA